MSALREHARLVSQWADAVDFMPDELRADLRHLGTLARTAPTIVSVEALAEAWEAQDPPSIDAAISAALLLEAQR